MTHNEIRQILNDISNTVQSGKPEEKPREFWSNYGSKLLRFIDDITRGSEKIALWLPKDYSAGGDCLLTALFHTIQYIPDVNQPFYNSIWTEAHDNDSNSFYEDHESPEKTYSFYILAYSRCCSLISQVLGDRLPYIQKILIKNLFDDSNIRSILASDLYMFIIRIINPNYRTPMCQLIMNLCKLAPSEALVKGAALINRFKHPVINFQNQKYQYLLGLL